MCLYQLLFLRTAKGLAMAKSYPYISGPNNISQMIDKLRKKFPDSVTSETIKQLGIAPKNESYVINALQFINLIDSDGKKNIKNAEAFVLPDEAFQNAFGEIIRDAYKSLFEVNGEEAWSLDPSDLTTFFRQSNQTSDVIGKRQASVFQIFAALSGKRDVISVKMNSKKIRSDTKREPRKAVAKIKPKTTTTLGKSFDSLGMSIKIDVNLPSDASKETYDNIFKSIREHLIDG